MSVLRQLVGVNANAFAALVVAVVLVLAALVLVVTVQPSSNWSASQSSPHLPVPRRQRPGRVPEWHREGVPRPPGATLRLAQVYRPPA